MLVLSRKQTQKVIIDTSDGPITVHVVTVRGFNVRLGFDAPKTCRIRRDELEKIDSLSVRENRKEPAIVGEKPTAPHQCFGEPAKFCGYCRQQTTVVIPGKSQCQNRDCPGKRI